MCNITVILQGQGFFFSLEISANFSSPLLILLNVNFIPRANFYYWVLCKDYISTHREEDRFLLLWIHYSCNSIIELIYIFLLFSFFIVYLFFMHYCLSSIYMHLQATSRHIYYNIYSHLNFLAFPFIHILML